MRPNASGTLTFSFMTNSIEIVIAQTKKTAGDKIADIVGGTDTTKRCLKAGITDELHIDIIPVLLIYAMQLIKAIGTEQARLERPKVMALPAVSSHLRFRVFIQDVNLSMPNP